MKKLLSMLVVLLMACMLSLPAPAFASTDSPSSQPADDSQQQDDQAQKDDATSDEDSKDKDKDDKDEDEDDEDDEQPAMKAY